MIGLRPGSTRLDPLPRDTNAGPAEDVVWVASAVAWSPEGGCHIGGGTASGNCVLAPTADAALLRAPDRGALAAAVVDGFDTDHGQHRGGQVMRLMMRSADIN